jgi:hypothetical protein
MNNIYTLGKLNPKSNAILIGIIIVSNISPQDVFRRLTVDEFARARKLNASRIQKKDGFLESVVHVFKAEDLS